MITEETRQKMRDAWVIRRLRPISESTREKMRKNMLGNTNTLGKKLSEEHKKKISDAVKGVKHPLWGKKFSDESRKKMSISHKSHIAWNKGKKYPQIAKEKHPNWKGGITPLNHSIRTSMEMKLWKKAVFERDNYICVFCSKPGGWSKELKRKIILNADHIKPFALFPEFRLSVDNGRTLCEECHRKTDTYAGKKILNNKTLSMI